MPVTQTRYQAPTYSRPVAMPGKPASKLPVAYPAPYGRVAISPPQRGSSANTSAVPSLTSDSGSNSSDCGDGGSSGIDLVELLNDKLSTTVSPMPLDRSLARQAQTSGELNAKNRELLELQTLAQRRLKNSRANFADGMKAAKEVKKDLEWTQKRVNTLKTNTERKYPKQYAKASQRYPSPEH
ncbi:hypothetical protein IMSHALPRED_008784 [Imshaugia aleurites]|uniref:Biogenesis of lysosome-related organelles complex 1 subunit KXD1 n=1 Tax=Imshaugia aleurites TaxID=172621 RepID=A0A8H3ITZ0_9LECA|nr:hypothetical protein IMSHALPRED_008784 [Imshaugia aleurites]